MLNKYTESLRQSKASSETQKVSHRTNFPGLPAVVFRFTPHTFQNSSVNWRLLMITMKSCKIFIFTRPNFGDFFSSIRVYIVKNLGIGRWENVHLSNSQSFCSICQTHTLMMSGQKCVTYSSLQQARFYFNRQQYCSLLLNKHLAIREQKKQLSFTLHFFH